MKRKSCRSVTLPKGSQRPFEREGKEKQVNFLNYKEEKYYTDHIEFAPWKWHIVIVRGMREYAPIIHRVRMAYGITGTILLIFIILLLYYLNKAVKHPISTIIGQLKKGEKPDYKGILEFEYLSSSLRDIIELRERETKILNNIYHIAVSRRGDEFFSEAVMAIERVFGLNAYIGKIIGNGEDVDVVAMYLNGELKRIKKFPLKGTPCEDVIAKKHMCVVEKDAYKEFPFSEALTAIKADSYIGVAVCDRNGNVVGIVSAFGKQREFTESDIKVFQTIGQMAATEFEIWEKEKAEKRIREELLQSQKLEAVGTLAGGIAHDFNNMLQGILGYASLLKMKISEADPIYKPLSVIEASAERAGELTKQLLGFARKGKYIVEPLNLNDVVKAVFKIISRTFDRAIEVKTSLQDGLWAVEGDRNQLEHVILNLCLNARDAMPAGGCSISRP